MGVEEEVAVEFTILRGNLFGEFLFLLCHPLTRSLPHSLTPDTFEVKCSAV